DTKTNSAVIYSIFLLVCFVITLICWGSELNFKTYSEFLRDGIARAVIFSVGVHVLRVRQVLGALPLQEVIGYSKYFHPSDAYPLQQLIRQLIGKAQALQPEIVPAGEKEGLRRSIVIEIGAQVIFCI